MAIDHDATTRKELLELVARVPDEELPTAKRMLLSLLVDPMWLSIESARVEQEELTPEARAALGEARMSLEGGEGLSHEEIVGEFGR